MKKPDRTLYFETSKGKLIFNFFRDSDQVVAKLGLEELGTFKADEFDKFRYLISKDDMPIVHLERILSGETGRL